MSETRRTHCGQLGLVTLWKGNRDMERRHYVLVPVLAQTVFGTLKKNGGIGIRVDFTVEDNPSYDGSNK
ncbi:MAG: hypothetical protein Salg2KO_23200 [Salibacteraceae bacterium]